MEFRRYGFHFFGNILIYIYGPADEALGGHADGLRKAVYFKKALQHGFEDLLQDFGIGLREVEDIEMPREPRREIIPAPFRRRATCYNDGIHHLLPAPVLAVINAIFVHHKAQ